MIGKSRRRRDLIKLLAFGAAGALLTTGCAIPSTLADGLSDLPDIPEPEFQIPDLSSLTAKGSPPPTAESAGKLTPVSLTATPAAGSPTPKPGSPTPSPRPSFVVGKTDGDGVYIRASIKPEKKVKLWPDGTTMIVIGEDVTVDNRVWKNVQDPAGNAGWVPAQYLVASPTASSKASPTATPVLATSRAASPAMWNTVLLDPLSNGNVPLAGEQLKALGAAEVKGRAQRAEPNALLENVVRYYGSIVRVEGFVSLIEQAPPESQLVKLLGFGVVQLAASCQDGTLVDFLQMGTVSGVRIGDLVAVYGLPVGQSQLDNRLTGMTKRLAVVSKVVEKVPR